MRRRTALGALLGAVGLSAICPTDWIGDALAAAGPRYFIRLRAVELAAGINAPASAAAPAPAAPASAVTAPAAPAPAGASGTANEALKTMARENLLEALGKRPEVVLKLEGVPDDAPPERFGEELKRRKLKGYEVTLNIIKLDRQVLPPPVGRKFRLLEQSIKLSLVGTLYPGEPTLALGGDGESTVQIEVGKEISENQDRDVLSDVVKDAVGQAVTQALRKLDLGPMKPPKDPPRRRK